MPRIPDTLVAGLALGAAALVLLAPVAGRLGHPGIADVAMFLAAGCGVASFVAAGIATVRSARRAPSREGEDS